MGCIDRQEVKDLLDIYEHVPVAINLTLINDNSITTNKQKRGYASIQTLSLPYQEVSVFGEGIQSDTLEPIDMYLCRP